MLTARTSPFCETCLKFAAIFRKIIIVFLGRNTPNSELDTHLWILDTNLKGHVALLLLRSICYELIAINLYLAGAAFSVSNICSYEKR